jgi:hypothetical protein
MAVIRERKTSTTFTTKNFKKCQLIYYQVLLIAQLHLSLGEEDGDNTSSIFLM